MRATTRACMKGSSNSSRSSHNHESHPLGLSVQMKGHPNKGGAFARRRKAMATRGGQAAQHLRHTTSQTKNGSCTHRRGITLLSTHNSLSATWPRAVKMPAGRLSRPAWTLSPFDARVIRHSSPSGTPGNDIRWLLCAEMDEPFHEMLAHLG